MFRSFIRFLSVVEGVAVAVAGAIGLFIALFALSRIPLSAF